MCFIKCIITCLLQCIEGIVQVLNHNAIIVMSVTGEGYVDAAKSTVGLIFSNFYLFIVVDFITGFIEFYAFILCALLPSAIGSLMIAAKLAPQRLYE